MNHHFAFTDCPPVADDPEVQRLKAELDSLIQAFTTQRSQLTHLLQRRRDIDAELLTAVTATARAQAAALLDQAVDVKAAAKHEAALHNELAGIG